MKVSKKSPLLLACCALAISGCSRFDHFNQPPSFSQQAESPEKVAMLSPGLPLRLERQRLSNVASLWSGGRQSLFGDRRAMQQGDIMTVVIEIDEEAEISNRTSRSRDASENLQIPQLLGIPQRVQDDFPDGAGLSEAVGLDSSSDASGQGSVRRNEQLTLRVAATVVNVLPNGVLSIMGSQEVRVNFEMRELSVSGFVRPEDVSRQNEITYDKIASARISYGGRGQITDVQQPRYGQQALDMILPF